MAINKYQRLLKTSQKLGETSDCSVMALAIAGQVTYPQARAALKVFGRKKGQGVYDTQILNAAHKLGIGTRRFYPKTDKGNLFTARSIGKVYPKGHYIVSYSGHVAAMVNGEVLDWTADKAHKVLNVWEMAKGGVMK